MDGKAKRTPTSTWSMKSTAHLPEEAEQIAGIRSVGEVMTPVEKEPDQTLVIGDSGGAVDKTKITDPLSGLSADTLSNWDTEKQELVKTVPVDCYITKSEPPSNQQVPLKGFKVQQQQQQAPPHVALSSVMKTVDRGIFRNYLTICRDDDDILPQKVTDGDLLMVKGDAKAAAQRQKRILKQSISLQGLSHLATRAPKTKAERYKTIHHLCTTPVADGLPSQACQLPVEPQLVQQRTALTQIPDQAQCRIVQQRLSAAEILVTSQEDCVTHLPSLFDWQRIPEHLEDRPRRVLCDRPVERLFRKSWSTVDVCRKSSMEPAACGGHAAKRSLLAPDLCSRLGVSVQVLANITTISRDSEDQQHPTLPPVTKQRVGTRTEPVKVSARGQGQRQSLLPQKRGRSIPRKRTVTARSKKHGFQGGRKLPLVLEKQRQPSQTHSSHHTQPSPAGPVFLDGVNSHHSQPSPTGPVFLDGVNSHHSQPSPTGPVFLDGVNSHHSQPSSAGPVFLYPSSSPPLLLDLESYTVQQGGIPVGLDPHEWVRNVWDTWCEELYLQGGSRHGKETSGFLEGLHRWRERELFLGEIRALAKVDLSTTSDTGVTDSDLNGEVARLTQSMANQDWYNAFDLCHRGALYKKVGRLNLAMEDLNKAISLESRLLDAYWHRHGIHLLKGNLTQALEDLNFIIKHNNKHADAFRSRAEIYRMKGDTMMAIANYSQAIKCKSDDDDMYFRRAQMYEKRSEILLAMEDYAKTFAMNPRRTDALVIHGLQYFHSGRWTNALTDFTLLLQLEPRSARARQYLGRIHAKLGQFPEAIEVLSSAVHLNPNDWLSFYQRGCLLRRVQPKAALQDLSTSVLINNCTVNLGAFLQRGLLYIRLNQWKQAMCDFKDVIKLDRSVALAHVNLGLIYMLKMKKNYKAIQLFTSGLTAEPTYVQGYIWRAEAYHNVKDFSRAVKDISRAIHMKPDDQRLYITRGQYLCDMGKFELASFYIQHAAQMGKALGLSPAQQGVIQSFLKNDSTAINQLLAAVDIHISPDTLTLLGKTQMKACRFMEAVESFRKALTLLNPDPAPVCRIPEAAELFYLIGCCYMLQDKFLQALDAFSRAVRINADFADAYHQRGLCRMRLQQAKSVQDFNRALSINPSLFQVYLSRATFYVDKGLYAKAILNCSEAIKIQPKSVRAYLHRGTLKFYIKMYSRAVEDFTMAIQIDSSCSFAVYNRGVCYQHMKQYDLALRDYGIVLLLASRKEIDLKVLINRALLYAELNDYHNALQDFKAASRKHPGDPTIFHALGVFHHRLGHLQESVQAYSEAVQLNPLFPEAYMGRGNVFMDYGHADASKQAQRDFVAALHLNPLCPTSRVSLGYNLQLTGSFQNAWNQFTVAAEMDPGCWMAFEGRAIVNLQMGNTFGAFHDINAALKHHPLSDLLYTNRGVINQFMGDRASAMKDYQKAISLNPDCALAFFNAANLYFYNRQFEQACKFYSRAFELDPSDDAALLNRAVTWALLLKFSEALQDFSMAQKLNPFNAHVFFNRANVYCSLRNYHSAEKDLTQALQLLPDDALMYKLRADVHGHLGLTELSISDYKMAIQLQEAEDGH